MMHSATRASARAACRRSAPCASTVASQRRQRSASSAAASLPLCRGHSGATWAASPQLLGRTEMIPPSARRGFASAVATFEEGVGERAPVAEAVSKAEEEKQTAEATPKPRRRRLLRDRPAPITLVRRGVYFSRTPSSFLQPPKGVLCSSAALSVLRVRITPHSRSSPGHVVVPLRYAVLALIIVCLCCDFRYGICEKFYRMCAGHSLHNGVGNRRAGVFLRGEMSRLDRPAPYRSYYSEYQVLQQ